MITKDNNYKVMKLFFDSPERKFHIREIAKLTKLSPAGVLKIVKRLKKEGWLVSEKKGIIEEIQHSGDRFIKLKECHNIFMLHESGLVEFLRDKYEEPEAIAVFGSYAKGEDNSKSDIDIAIITEKEIKPDLSGFEKTLKRKISLYEISIENAEKEFINSLANGIVLYGYLKVV